MGGLHELTVREAAAAVRARQVSPVELLAALLERTDRLDSVVGAYATRTTDLAVEQARGAERAVLAARPDEPLPPLLGVPVPVKDLADVTGVPTGFGSRAFAHLAAPTTDSSATARLRAAGAVLPGKTSTPELGLPCYTEPDTGPPARTPWDLSRSAGGSSGGAAAAVSAGLVPAAHASDGGGSIRIPASACGLVGLKASRGRVSPGVERVELFGLATEGALTREVRDAALLLDVLAGDELGDTWTAPPPRTTFLGACERVPDPLRVGLLVEPVVNADAAVHPACRAAAEQVAGALAELGHHVEPAPVAFPADRFDAFTVVWGSLAALAPVPPEREHLLVPLTRWLRASGRAASAVELAAAVAGIQLATRETARAWAPYDVVLTPTLARPPAPVGSLRDDGDPAGDFRAQTRFTPWTSVANLTGRPSISLPLVRARVDGPASPELPIGVLLTGTWAGEELLLGLAAQLEAALPWAGSVPRDPTP